MSGWTFHFDKSPLSYHRDYKRLLHHAEHAIGHRDEHLVWKILSTPAYGNRAAERRASKLGYGGSAPRILSKGICCYNFYIYNDIEFCKEI